MGQQSWVRVVSGVMAYVIGFSLSTVVCAPTFAQDVLGWGDSSSGAEIIEAKTFFERLQERATNPAIVAMARESLARLSQQQKSGKASEAGDGRVVAFANTPKTDNQTGYRREYTVSLFQQNNNNSLAVPVMINRKTMGTFIVDTGSTYTVISPRMAKKLGIVFDETTPRISIITGNGVIKAPMVTVDSITVGEVEVKNVQVIVQHLGKDVLLAGLLGMNFFRDMDMSVRKDKLVLSMRNE